MRSRKSSSKPASARLVPGSALQIGLFAAGLLCVAAIIADLSRPVKLDTLFPDVTAELKTALLEPPGPTFADPKGFFRMPCPAGWKTDVRPEGTPYDVVFFSPNRASISIMATRVKYNDLPSLFTDIEKNEAEFGIRTEVETIRFKGMPAVKRTCTLNMAKLFAIDFVNEYVAHHILCRAPKDYYDQYVPVLMELLDRYEPLNPAAAGAAPTPQGAP